MHVVIYSTSQNQQITFGLAAIKTPAKYSSNLKLKLNPVRTSKNMITLSNYWRVN